MKLALLAKTVNFFTILALLLWTQTSWARHIGRKKQNLQYYTVSVPKGYGALSAYHALPSALSHAPYALSALNQIYTGKNIGSVRYFDFVGDDKEGKSANDAKTGVSVYSLDPETLIKLFAHEFEDGKTNKKILKQR